MQEFTGLSWIVKKCFELFILEYFMQCSFILENIFPRLKNNIYIYKNDIVCYLPFIRVIVIKFDGNKSIKFVCHTYLFQL
jgi:hypothetical protein